MRWLYFTLLLGLGGAGTGLPQSSCLEQVRFPEVGRWAEYQAQYENDPYTIRYSVIGSEERGGKSLTWVEMQMTGARTDGNLVYQILVPSLAEIAEVQEVVFKPGDQPARKISGQMLVLVRGQLEKQSFLKDVCKGVSLVGKESVKVPAGKFQALHFHSAEYGSDSWVSPDVPFSMVKTTGKQFQMEFAAHGEGAKSSITETPQEMGGMGARPN